MQALGEHLRALADSILERVSSVGVLDVVNDYAQCIASAAVAHVIGVRLEDEADFRQSVTHLIGNLGQAVEGAFSTRRDGPLEELFVVLEKMMADPKPSPNTLLSAVRRAQDQGEIMAEEALAFLVMFLFAGQENIMNFIGNAVLALVEWPEQTRLLRERRVSVTGAIDELLRFDSPVQFMMLTAVRDTGVRGSTLRMGQRVLVGIASANRDERRFLEPDRLELARADRRHLTFGRGPLTCIGANLARLEGAVAIDALAGWVREPHIIGAPQLRAHPNVLRGLSALLLARG